MAETKSDYDRRRYADPAYRAALLAGQQARRATLEDKAVRRAYRQTPEGKKVIAAQEKRSRERATAQRRLSINLRNRLGRRLKGTLLPGNISELIGCSFEFFRGYLAGKFKPGMSFDNYGEGGWELDHVDPLATFDLTNPKQVKRAFHYTNLQPLWPGENSSKGYRS